MIEESAKERIILPLDVPKIGEALRLHDALCGHVGKFKIGLEFIFSMLAGLLSPKVEGTVAYHNLTKARDLFHRVIPSLFLDGKFCDIPNTVKGASLAVSGMGVSMFNIHASAGREAIKAAVASKGESFVLGVTVLTSISQEECQSIFGAFPDEIVHQFADMLLEEGADGIICSPKELEILEEEEYDNLIKVIPGVRPKWASKGDQKRVMTPYDAIMAGADYLVIGRPITSPPEEIGDSVQAAILVAKEIAEALEERDER